MSSGGCVVTSPTGARGRVQVAKSDGQSLTLDVRLGS
jgi:hypothetical protein